MGMEPTPEEIRDRQLFSELGLTPSEYQQVQHHLGRLPNWTELGIYSVMWSEHCSYKNSKPLLKRLPTDGPRVLQGPGEGAGVIDIGDGQAVVFKIESHNHPTAVEPFQGAATGVGGIIRDVFSMGARPVALLNSLRFGPLESPRVRYLFEQAVAGIAHYGNIVGIPTVGGEVEFDATYEGNPLVNAMCVGIIDHEDLQQGVAKGIGNPVIYVGASTGRDGIHGATFASEELSDASEEKRPSVQAGDPFMEKLLMEACLELVQKEILLGIQDMGAAGLTCSSAEMTAKGGVGLDLYLDDVPQREVGMTPYEIMLSESQERMLLVVAEGREAEVKEVLDKWELPSAVVGRVTEGNRYRIFHHRECVADMPVNTLVDDAPINYRQGEEPSSYRDGTTASHQDLHHLDATDALQQVLRAPSLASKRWVYQQYDSMVRTSTAVRPGSDAAVIVLDGFDKALAMSVDGNSRYVKLDPWVGGASAVAEAARNVVCAGARPLAITDCLNFGNPEKPEVFWQLENAIDGMGEACRQLATPVVGGNVSLYNETKGVAIHPTPVVGMVGLVESQEHITTQSFKQAGDVLLLLGSNRGELGGSELQQQVLGSISGRPPVLDLEAEKALQSTVLHLIQTKTVSSAHDLSTGGLAVALAEAAFANALGVHMDVKTDLETIPYLFGESQSRVLLSLPKESVAKAISMADEKGVPWCQLGEVRGDRLSITINGSEVISQPVSRLQTIWEEAIPCAMNASLTN
ncbi:phosphoribosylformylglycinamidine synthase subunit PurL [Marininema halotolerans]|nr:phosphoribosylformylglycinamidine synthase subunit PurL [Marininema halotolerans]